MSGSDAKTVCIWDAETGKLLRTLEGHTDSVQQVSWSPDSRCLVSGSVDKTVRVWDVETGKLLRTLDRHAGSVQSVSWSPDSRYLVSGSYDNWGRVWDAETGKLLRALKGHIFWVRSVSWSPDGRTVVSGSGDKTVRVWDAETGKLLRTLQGHTDSVHSATWSPDSRFLVSGSHDNTLRVWEAETGKLLRTLEGNTSNVRSLSWSPDNRFLVSGSYDSTVRVWEAETGKLLRTLQGHTNSVESVSWSPDSRYLVSGSDDKTIRLWDAQTSKLLRTLEGHTSSVRSVSWSPDGRFLVSGSHDNTIRLWDAETGVELGRETFPLSYVPVAVSFEKSVPVSQSFGEKRLDENEIIVRSIDPISLKSVPSVDFKQYVSAKLVLVGESEVGKSCLALRLAQDRYEEQGTTHGMRLWKIPAGNLSLDMAGPPEENREIVIWDLGGQEEYRLVHQLFLPDTTLAMILFDPTRGQKGYDDVTEWNLRLEKQASQRKTTKLLVGTKLDQQKMSPDKSAMDQLIGNCDCHGFLQVSAKERMGIDELREAIAAEIDWDGLSKTSRPDLFQRIREIVDEYQQRGDVVLLYDDLVNRIRFEMPDDSLLDPIATVVSQLAGQGTVVNSQLASGQRVLVLQVGYIETYAGSIIMAAKANPRGVPAIEITEALRLKSYPGIDDKDRLPVQKERIVLECVIELLLRHGICLRHQGLLIFPSLFRPATANDEKEVLNTISLYYDFTGAIDNIYSSLVARLALSGRFGRVRLWPTRAEYDVPDHGVCGIRKDDKKSGRGHLDLYFSNEATPETRNLFTVFVEEHLRNEGVTIKEVLGITCGKCGSQISQSVVEDRIKGDYTDVGCQKCDARWPIIVGAEKLRDTDPEVAATVFALKTEIEKKQKEETSKTKQAMTRRKKGSELKSRILHLSDLHFTAVDDWATKLQDLITDLRAKEAFFGGFDYLDGLVVSGDLTNRAAPQEFENAYNFLDGLINQFNLSAERCVIVPGNHDLAWKPDPYDWKRKNDVAADELKPGHFLEDGNFYGIRDEERYKNRFENFGRFYHQLLMRPYPLKADEQGLVFLLAEPRIQILALNSAWKIDEYHRNDSDINQSALTFVFARAKSQIDDAVKQNLIDGKASVLKIAVWHHPVTGKEQIKDDDYLERLRKEGVNLGLHGHVHEDTAEMVRYKDPRKFFTAGAGSFGAVTDDRPASTPQLYNLLEISHDHSNIRVHTRCKKKDGGAWGRWPSWPDGRNKHDLSYYDIKLADH